MFIYIILGLYYKFPKLIYNYILILDWAANGSYMNLYMHLLINNKYFLILLILDENCK